MDEAIALGVKRGFAGLLLDPAGTIGHDWLVPAYHAFVALHFWTADCVDAFEGLCMDIRLVVHDVFACGERDRGLAVFTAIVFILEDVLWSFGGLCLGSRLWVLGNL